MKPYSIENKQEKVDCPVAYPWRLPEHALAR
jgi:hypothetical protein